MMMMMMMMKTIANQMHAEQPPHNAARSVWRPPCVSYCRCLDRPRLPPRRPAGRLWHQNADHKFDYAVGLQGPHSPRSPLDQTAAAARRETITRFFLESIQRARSSKANFRQSGHFAPELEVAAAAAEPQARSIGRQIMVGRLRPPIASVDNTAPESICVAVDLSATAKPAICRRAALGHRLLSDDRPLGRPTRPDRHDR
jgi:hypothetical protein